MASVYDKNNMSAEDQKKLEAYGVQYTQAKLKNDKASMDSAHAAAEALRSGYGYSGGKDGSQYSKVETPTASPTLPTPVDNTGAIQSMYANIGAAQTASLNSARDQANSDYQAQIEGAPAQFAPLKDQVDVGTVRNIQRANEVAAAKGTTFSGGVQSDAGATVASGEGQKTALNQQEANVVTSLKKAIADNNRATSMKQIEMTAQNQAQMTQAQIDEQNRLYNTKYQSAQDTLNNNINISGITGYYNGNKTLQAQQMDTSNQQWEKQFNASMDQWGKQFDYQVGRDKVLDANWEKSFAADQANASAGRSIQWAGVQLDREKFEESKKTMVTDAKLSDQGSEIYKNALNMVSDTLSVSDDMGNVVDKSKWTPAQIFEFIYSSSLGPEEKLKIIERIPGLKKK